MHPLPQTRRRSVSRIERGLLRPGPVATVVGRIRTRETYVRIIEAPVVKIIIINNNDEASVYVTSKPPLSAVKVISQGQGGRRGWAPVGVRTDRQSARGVLLGFHRLQIFVEGYEFSVVALRV